MKELPTFQGYTFNPGLAEFRRTCIWCRNVSGFPFRSAKGARLLHQLLSFYDAGGALYTIEHSNQEMKVTPIPRSLIEEIMADLNLD